MMGNPGKWPLKKGSLMVTFLIAFQLQHAVNQQQRIAMRQNFQDVVNVEPGLGCARAGIRRSAFSHASFSISLKIILYRVAWRSNSRQQEGNCAC